MITTNTASTNNANTLKGVIMADCMRAGVSSIIVKPSPPRSFQCMTLLGNCEKATTADSGSGERVCAVMIRTRDCLHNRFIVGQNKPDRGERTCAVG
ncbi:hypothetical protein SBF1_1030021 [Candidatus Desulfosporosinus infrequens]|uniref:Uncharacterized protein n=1 Tax=Candidatus Desulfosporosinus infrequens TaxID=2043169 RepID=A0A2U3JWQ7_9FIRM|nr:hypothetical protein SBF1_1030021 [Candidatus Desulfosporosinus infrequens]